MSALERARRALAAHQPVEDAPPEARQAAVALVLVPETSDLTVLFIRRADREGDPWSGHVAFPGGRHEAGDAALVDTAIRETREELGVDLARAERLGVLDDLYPRTPVLPPVVVRPFVFTLPRRPKLHLSDEVRAGFWVPLGDLRAPGVHRDVTLNIRGEARVFPAYVLGEDVIWGMTERILSDLMRLTAP